MELINRLTPLTLISLHKLINQKDIHYDINELFKKNNKLPTIETMFITCSMGSLDNTRELITKYKINPNKQCLDASVRSDNMELILLILSYRFIPDINTIKYCKDKITHQKIELLIKHGLVMTYDILDQIIKYECYVENLERFDMSYGEKLYFLCFKHKKDIPYYNEKFTIDKNTLILRNMCKNKPVSIITKFMEKNELKLDRYGVDNAYIYGTKGSKGTKAYMENLGYNPTIIAIVHISGYDTNEAIDLINVNSDYMCFQFTQ